MFSAMSCIYNTRGVLSRAARRVRSHPVAGVHRSVAAARASRRDGRRSGAVTTSCPARCSPNVGASLRGAGAETVPLPGGLDPGRAAALGICGVAAWTALAGTGALRPGESVLVLGAHGQVGRIAVQAPRLLGARRVTGVVQHETARQAPLRLGADTVLTSQDLPTLTERLLEPDQRGYDVILDTLWGPVIPAAAGAAATGARVVHLGNSARALATLAGPAIRKNGLSPGFPAREPSAEALPLTSGNCQNLPARTGEGPGRAEAPQPLVPS